MFNLPATQFLVASIIAGIIGFGGLLVGTSVIEAPVTIALQPSSGVRVVGEPFVVTLTVDSTVPVNAFRGLITFDPSTLSIQSIDYNTSIANLWAEEPWYSNGDGTITFAGGTTVSGGFLGQGSLITITFKAASVGETLVKLSEMQVLQHDGLGSDAELNKPIDGLFSVEETSKTVLYDSEVKGPEVIVVPEKKNGDLNGDGTNNMTDVSIFMADLATQNTRSDLNGDGKVTLKDLSILTR